MNFNIHTAAYILYSKLTIAAPVQSTPQLDFDGAGLIYIIDNRRQHYCYSYHFITGIILNCKKDQYESRYPEEIFKITIKIRSKSKCYSEW